MAGTPDIAALAALIGDPARARMLEALMSGRALAAGELANEAGVTAQTASAHLTKMIDAGLLLVEAQGRHRYYRLAGPAVAAALESMMGLAARTGRLRTRPGPRDAAMRRARVCYDHLAGEAGVRQHDAMVARGDIVATAEGLALSPAGRRRLVAEGVDLTPLDGARRAQCRLCLDWSERRPHLAGALGAILLRHILAAGWARRDPKSRAVLFTPPGERAFDAFLAEDETRPAGRSIA
ncbi:MAG TPA: metalloregulator ArsR/SmtB family transcription factor [Rhodoblastus sp.]|nr:metalloregulator ArsR/SmtB family transcription factor [Rhodoblastus sp.]